jgi:hypothetical protein
VTPADVTSDIKVRRGSLHGGEATNGEIEVEQTVTLSNTSGGVLAGPLAVALGDLPEGVTLANATGSYQGHPYVDVLGSGAALAPGQRVRLTLEFLISGRHRNRADLNYDLDVLEGV